MSRKEIKNNHRPNFLDSLLDSVPDIIFYKSPDGIYLDCNKKYAELYGNDKKDVIGKNDYELFDKKLADIYSADDKRIISSGQPIEFELWSSYPDGREVFLHTIKTPQYDSEGNILGILGISRDLTQIKKYEQRLAEREKYLAVILETAKDGFYVLEMDGTIVSVNQACCDSVGYTREELIGMNVRQIDGKFNSDEISDNIKQILDSGSTMLDTVHKRKDGVPLNVEVSVTLLELDKKYMICFSRDITERKLELREKEILSYYDHLTGLYNRRYLEKELARLDNNLYLPLSIISIDVNDLKLTNDAFGHQGGDDLLRAIADTLRKSCREGDILGRAGGDEFSIYLPRSDKSVAERVKERILKEISLKKVDPLILSISIGYAVKNYIEQDINEVIKEADTMMYYDKIQFSRQRKHEVLNRFMQTIFSKAPSEKDHCERVADYSLALAKAYGMSEENLQGFKEAAMLHDIGKITVSETTLSKYGELSISEFEEMKQHPAISYRILKGVETYTVHSRAVLYHHERWDGKGYPMGAKGERIPVLSRIMAIADGYEIMTRQRAGIEPILVNDAIEELRRKAGTEYDPELVEIFVEKVLKTSEGAN